jgi:hypothetical protein
MSTATHLNGRDRTAEAIWPEIDPGKLIENPDIPPPQAIGDTIGLIGDPAHKIEIRSLDRKGRMTIRHFDGGRIRDATRFVLETDVKAQAVYLLMNPPIWPLVTGTERGEPSKSASDPGIAYRRWLLVDADPIRPADTSSTLEEKRAALRVLMAICKHLKGRGWPQPVIADSGNGWHLLFRIDLPNDDEARDLIKNVLRALAHKFDDAAATIDTKVYNASRITKLYGSVTRKGTASADRPHRYSRIVHTPAVPNAVPVGQLADLAREAMPAEPPKSPSRSVAGKGGASRAAADNLDKRVTAYLTKCPGAISGQGGHTQTLKTAISLGPGFNLSPDECLAYMRQYNTKCEPQWSDRELEHKVTEAYKVESQRGWLLDADRAGYQKPKATRSKAASADDEAPSVLPLPGVAAGDDASFSNYRTESGQGEEKSVRVALRVSELDRRLEAIVGHWPKRVRDTLFWESEQHEPVYLRSAPQLFAWIDKRAQVDWTKGAKFIPQERFYEHKRMTSEKFEAIETLPHWPPLPGVYYMHEAIPKSGGFLGELVDYFNPATDEDRQLILCMILTLFWGGAPGSRPAFLITGPDQDPLQGRGVGKSLMPQILAQELIKGYINVLPTEDIATVKTRLLSEGGNQARMAMIDNIKTLRFSWGDLEGLITDPLISGRALYLGNGTRPNSLVWVLTVNGASLSKDMAQRCIVIKLDRPPYRAGWAEEVRDFIRAHRPEILAEIRDTLEADPVPLKTRSRWASWESGVLSKVPRAESCQKLIAARQETVDDDNEERDNVAERFREEIKKCGGNPIGERCFISSHMAAKWINRASNKNMPTNQASSLLRGLGIPELRKSQSNGEARGWYWTGPEANPNAETHKLKDADDWGR